MNIKHKLKRKSDSKPSHKKRKIKSEYIWGWTFASIPLIGFVLFGFLPLVISIWLSLRSLHGFQLINSTWVGLDNFIYVLKDTRFYKSVLNTMYASLSVPISMMISLLIAVLLNQNIKGKIIFRTIFFIPFVCSIVAVSIMWKWMLDANYGIINDMLSHIGIIGPDWLGNSKYLMPAMILMGIWSGMGFNIIIFSAALTNVDYSCYEAAEIDGAGKFRKFFSITIPSISPTTFYLLIMGLIGAFQDFARFQIMAPGGGPNESGLTIVYYLYSMGFENVIIYGMGLASAVAWILAIFIIGITFFNFKLSKKWVHY